MKRLLFGAGLAAAFLAVATCVFWGFQQRPVPAVRLVPGHSAIFVELADLRQTAKRWKETALAKILKEPSVKAFLRRPLEKLRIADGELWRELERLRPTAAFFCSPSGRVADGDWVVGIRSGGPSRSAREQVLRLVDRIVTAVVPLQAAESGSSSGLTPASPPRLMVEQAHGWILVGRSRTLLNSLLQPHDGKHASLETDPCFKKCREQVSREPDLLTYVQAGKDLRLSALRGFPLVPVASESTANIEAIIGATALEGAQIRDTIFTCGATGAAGESFTRPAQAYASAETMLFLSTRLKLGRLPEAARELAKKWAFAENLDAYFNRLEQSDAQWKWLLEQVSAVTVMVNRNPDTDAIDPIVAINLKDPAAFKALGDKRFDRLGFLDDLEKSSSVLGCWRFGSQTPTSAALVGNDLIVAQSPEALETMLAGGPRPDSDGLQLNAGYQAVRHEVGQPTELLAFVDARPGFERLYDAMRPMLVLGVAIVPNVQEYVDTDALPPGPDIGCHLSPIILSKRQVAGGVIDESVGPVTAYQAFLLFAGGAVASGVLDWGTE
jgi:hypothetical protein